MKKVYMIILDGAADHPIPELDNKTPLEAADIPNISKLASNGAQSLIEIIGDGIIPESDSGAMALLSYDPRTYYPGRGTLEGIGTGLIPEGYEYAAFRVNFASYDNETGQLDRRTARGLEEWELQELAKAINKYVDLKDFGMNFRLFAFGHHRGILCLYSDKRHLSGNVTNTDPGFEKKGVWGVPIKSKGKPKECMPLDEKEESKLVADAINSFSKQAREILTKHSVNVDRKKYGNIQANYIIVRDGGNPPCDMPTFKQKYNKSLTMYGQLPAERAIASLIGESFVESKALDFQLDPEFLQTAAERVINELSDVVFIHIKGPDEPGHDNKPFEKVKAIEMIDKYFFSKIITNITSDDLIVVTCDHATPCELMLHSNDSVPLLISGDEALKDGNSEFNENTANLGALPVKRAVDLLDYLFKMEDKR